MSTGMGEAGMKYLRDKLAHVGSSENPLLTQIWGGFTRSEGGKALRSFVLPVLGWQLPLSDQAKRKQPVAGLRLKLLDFALLFRQADTHIDTQHRDTIHQAELTSTTVFAGRKSSRQQIMLDKMPTLDFDSLLFLLLLQPPPTYQHAFNSSKPFFDQDTNFWCFLN